MNNFYFFIIGSRKASASDYLKKVKSSLEPSKYNAFSQMTRTYRVDKNFDVLLATLKDIFLRGSQMPQLFRGNNFFLILRTLNIQLISISF